MLNSIFRIPRERDFYKKQAEDFAQIIASMKVAIRKQGEDKAFCSQHCIYRKICGKGKYKDLSCDDTWQQASLNGEYLSSNK